MMYSTMKIKNDHTKYIDVVAPMRGRERTRQQRMMAKQMHESVSRRLRAIVKTQKEWTNNGQEVSIADEVADKI